MNNEKIEVSAMSVEAAVKKGLEKLGLAKEEAEWEILQEAGFLRHCKILIGKKPSQSDLARDYAEKMLELMGFDYAVETTETENEILIQLTGVNAGDIIGRRGDVLDAFQYMLNVLTKNFDDDFKRVTVDTENYRAKRAETLVKLARNLEKKVRRTAKPVRLEYMNPFERRTIHTALQDSPFVDTASERATSRAVMWSSSPKPDSNRAPTASAEASAAGTKRTAAKGEMKTERAATASTTQRRRSFPQQGRSRRRRKRSLPTTAAS